MSQTFIVGNREYTCQPMNPFAGNKILMRIQKVATPILGALAGGGAKSLADMDVGVAARLLADNLDELMMDDIVLPMFAEAKVFDNEKKRFIRSGADIDVVFTIENLFDLYELIWEVGRFQFTPFFEKMAARFGVLLGGAKTTD